MSVWTTLCKVLALLYSQMVGPKYLHVFPHYLTLLVTDEKYICANIRFWGSPIKVLSWHFGDPSPLTEEFILLKMPPFHLFYMKVDKKWCSRVLYPELHFNLAQLFFPLIYCGPSKMYPFSSFRFNSWKPLSSCLNVSHSPFPQKFPIPLSPQKFPISPFPTSSIPILCYSNTLLFQYSAIPILC